VKNRGKPKGTRLEDQSVQDWKKKKINSHGIFDERKGKLKERNALGKKGSLGT